MRRILDRYILKEVVGSWLAVTGVLLTIILTNQLAKVLQRAAENQYPRGVVLELIGLGVLQDLSVIVPVALLLGVVLAFGRLYHDSEMAAALACGAGPSRLYFPVSLLAIAVAALLAWLTLDIAPAAWAKTMSLRSEALRAGQFAPIAPGRFRTFGGGNAVVYAESVNPDGTLTNVFVERQHEQTVEVAVAKHARHSVGPDGMTHTITLYDGEHYEGVPGSPRFRILRFAEDVFPVQAPKGAEAVTRPEAQPTRVLLTSKDLPKRAELHWRIAAPIMCLVLSLLAVPLSRLRPRQGRYARIGPAILLYFVYSNFVTAGQTWIAQGKMPEVMGLWWVHALVVLLTLSAIYLPGSIARLRYKPVATGTAAVPA